MAKKIWNYIMPFITPVVAPCIETHPYRAVLSWRSPPKYPTGHLKMITTGLARLQILFMEGGVASRLPKASTHSIGVSNMCALWSTSKAQTVSKSTSYCLRSSGSCGMQANEELGLSFSVYSCGRRKMIQILKVPLAIVSCRIFQDLH